MDQHKFRCDRCKLNYYSDRKRKDWRGRVVCDNCDLPKPAFLLPRPMVKEIIVPKDVRPNTPRPDALPQPGISRWGGPYLTIDGWKANITWNEWTSKWND